MSETTLAWLYRGAPWVSLFVVTIVALDHYSESPTLFWIYAGVGVPSALLAGGVEGMITAGRRRMLVWADPPAGEAGPCVTIPWCVAQWLHGNEWVTLPMGDGGGIPPTADPWARIAAWLAHQQGSIPMWCPRCNEMMLGYEPGPVAHHPLCERGRAIETLRVCMEHAALRAGQEVK